jgi:hypothetical protein
MNSYIVKLVFNINIGNGLHRSQFDEQTIFINASNKEDAFYKAKVQGKILEEKFSNDKDQSVEWKFIDVIDVFELRSYKNGEPLYSITHETEDSSAFIDFIHHRSQIIQTKLLSFA